MEAGDTSACIASQTDIAFEIPIPPSRYYSIYGDIRTRGCGKYVAPTHKPFFVPTTQKTFCAYHPRTVARKVEPTQVRGFDFWAVATLARKISVALISFSWSCRGTFLALWKTFLRRDTRKQYFSWKDLWNIAVSISPCIHQHRWKSLKFRKTHEHLTKVGKIGYLPW